MDEQRWAVADDLTRPIVDVVAAAEELATRLELADDAKARLYGRGWRLHDGRWIPPRVEWPQLLR